MRRQRRKIILLIPNYFKVPLIIATLIAIITEAISDRQLEIRNRIEYKKDCYVELQRTFKGIVTYAQFDNDINVKAFVIYLNNGYRYVSPIFLKSLNGEIEPGDSIFKEKGAFRFTIYKKGTFTPYIHEDTVDCQKLTY